MKLVIADATWDSGPQRSEPSARRICRVHWTRNILDYFAANNRTAVAAMPKTTFAQENKAAAEQQWDEVADALRSKRQDRRADAAAREDVLAYVTFPKEH